MYFTSGPYSYSDKVVMHIRPSVDGLCRDGPSILLDDKL